MRQFLANADLGMLVLWAGLAVFTLAVVGLLWTRWGQYHSLSKCLILSMLAHVLMAGYAANSQLLDTPLRPPAEPLMRISLEDGVGSDQSAGDAFGSATGEASPAERKPWEGFARETIPEPGLPKPAPRELPAPAEPKRQSATEAASLPGLSSLDHLALTQVQMPEPAKPNLSARAARSGPVEGIAEIEVPQAERREPPATAGPEETPVERRQPTGPSEPGSADEAASRDRVPSTRLEPVLTLPVVPPTSAGPDSSQALSVLPDQLASASPGPGGTVAQSAGGAGALRTPLPSAAVLGEGAFGTMPASGAGGGAAGAGAEKPDDYKLRTAPNRDELARQHGATAESEAAVRAALRWLTEGQAADGHWSARQHGAGQELFVLGRNRGHAGVEADTGVTGLALLAFLAAGHTHRQGEYRENVRRGLEYLLRMQDADGNLAAHADTFARMYCHGMASIAMSEDYGMTRDQRLLEPVRRAVAYTVACQHPTTGGWRYQPLDPGDTSQFGWQLMVLKSAHLAGIPVTDRTRQGMIRYLGSVAGGQHGGLASYRPAEQVSRSMTAESLLCWQLLGLSRDHPAAIEGANYLVGQLPGDGKPNFYYWYYATLALYQMQGPQWQKWNAALQAALVGSQRKDDRLAGSWDTNEVWGGYGGRIYTTAMATLCLEVYYRYLPLYGRTGQVAKNGE